MAALDPQSTFRALLPEPFGKYSLLGHLATGGMAEVWLARQRGLQGFEKIVVIKRARRDLADDDTARCVLDEARLLATLEHPNIAQVYEIGFVNGAYFFVMEYVDGADLRGVIETAIARQHAIALGDALYIIAHVCAALHYAHEKRDLEGRALQIIHRDVSPSNVLISHDGAIKVCDFGIAHTDTRPADAPQPDVLRGKVSYLSPEQCSGEPIDRRSDVFSIGILLYELSTLSKLFRAGGDLALLQHLIEQPIPPPSTRVADYPAELEAIVMKALARRPDDRYQTAQELQLALEAFAREHKLATSSVNVGKLMAALFERRNDGWIRAQRAHSDHFIEAAPVEPLLATGTPAGAAASVGHNAQLTSPRGPASTTPTSLAATIPLPITTTPTSLAMVTPLSSLVSTRSARIAKVAPVPVRPPRRWAPVWLAAAAIAAVIAVGVTVAGQVVAASANKAAAAALLADAERVSAAFDATARAAHLRADGIAATPMLRAAIETEHPSLRDLASAETIFTAHPGESLDVFQLRGGQSSLLLHVPPAAAALPVLKGRETRIWLAGRDATLIASAPISGYQDNLVGGLVIAMPVDLAAVRRSLAAHAERAIVRGLAGPAGGELVLTGDRDATTSVALAVPSGGEWSAEGVTLHAIPRRVEGFGWAAPVRNLAAGLSLVLLLGFAVVFTRRPRTPDPSST